MGNFWKPEAKAVNLGKFGPVMAIALELAAMCGNAHIASTIHARIQTRASGPEDTTLQSAPATPDLGNTAFKHGWPAPVLESGSRLKATTIFPFLTTGTI
jgi:hypothetical protein